MNHVMPMVENAAVILLATMLLTEIRHRFEKSYFTRGVLLGALFALAGAVVMNNSVELVQGTRTDPRLAVVTLAATFGGPVSAVITAGALTGLRLSYGGLGALPGAASILAVAMLSTLVWGWWKVYLRRPAGQIYLIVQAVSSGVVSAVVISLVAPLPASIFLTSIALFAPANMLVVWIMGTFFLREDQRRAALKAQAETEARIRGIANNAPLVLCQFMINPSGRLAFTYLSDASKRILGISSAGVIADPARFLSGLTDDSGDAFASAIARSMATGGPFTVDLEYTIPGGEPVWLMVAAGLRANDEGVQLWDGTITDITWQKMGDFARMISSPPTAADPPLIDLEPGLAEDNASAVRVA